MIPELKGFYLPYETVRGPVHCRVSCRRTAKVYGFDGFVNDEFVNGSKQLDNLLLDAMEPFDLDGLEAFDFAYVAGQHVKITDISDAEAERRMTEEVSENTSRSWKRCGAPRRSRSTRRQSQPSGCRCFCRFTIFPAGISVRP